MIYGYFFDRLVKLIVFLKIKNFFKKIILYNACMVNGKKILIVGLANKYSIASAIATSCMSTGCSWL